MCIGDGGCAASTADGQLYVKNYIGIGEPSPSKNLDVKGSIEMNSSSAPLVWFVENDQTPDKTWTMGVDAGNFWIREDGTLSANERLRIAPGGKVGIGTSGPSNTLTLKDTGTVGSDNYVSGFTGYGWYLDPVMITPVLHKEEYLQDPFYSRIFSTIWKKAKEALSKCERLIVIGYSFPTTDFLTKKLFLESFSENTLEELIVVNPDTSIVQKVKNLCHFEKPIVICKDLHEFIYLKQKREGNNII